MKNQITLNLKIINFHWGAFKFAVKLKQMYTELAMKILPQIRTRKWENAPFEVEERANEKKNQEKITNGNDDVMPILLMVLFSQDFLDLVWSNVQILQYKVYYTKFVLQTHSHECNGNNDLK